MSRQPTGSNETPSPSPSSPTWRSNEFDSAPTEEQLNRLRAEEQRQQELKAQNGLQRATVTDAVKAIKKEDFLNLHKLPCARQGFLVGFGGGAAVGALRFVLGAPIPKSANWAVGACIASATASYEWCQYQRRKERESMKRMIEVYDQKTAEEKKKKAEEKRRKEEEGEAARLLAAQRKNWYKFW